MHTKSIPELSPEQIERFWSKVDKTGDCWLWTDALSRSGYARVHVGGQMCAAHRVAYTLAYGPIPDGLTIDHVRARGCVHRHCVNPAHLEAVTSRVNQLRSSSFTAQNAAKTHCKNGHPLTPDNLLPGYSNRRCKACHRAYGHSYWKTYRRTPEQLERHRLAERARYHAAKKAKEQREGAS